MTHPHPKPTAALKPKPRKKSQAKKITSAGTTEPIKHRLEVASNGAVEVVDSKAGSVSLLDRLKAYYHTLTVVIAFVLVVLNHVTPVVPLQYRGWFDSAVILVTAAVNALKSNEKWVDNL